MEIGIFNICIFASNANGFHVSVTDTDGISVPAKEYAPPFGPEHA